MDATVGVALWLSLKVAGLATLLNIVLGTAAGFALARWRFAGRDVLDTVLTLPMVMPPTVLGYYLLVLLGRNGPIGGWLQNTFGINLIFTCGVRPAGQADVCLFSGAPAPAGSRIYLAGCGDCRNGGDFSAGVQARPCGV